MRSRARLPDDIARKKSACVLCRIPSTVWSFRLMRSTAHLRRQRLRVHGKPMVLRGDFHPARCQILHRLVRAAMAELQFERLPAKRLAQNLVPQANAKNRNAASSPNRSPRAPHNPAPPDRPGRWKEKFPPAYTCSASAAVAVAGTTCTLKPCCRNRRRMLYFIPKSNATMGMSAAGNGSRTWRASRFSGAARQIEARALLILFVPAETPSCA